MNSYSDDREIKRNLMNLLKEIRNERDYILGTVTVAGVKEVYCELIAYINLEYESGKTPNPDDILALALSLRRKYDEVAHKKAVAAML